MPDIPRLRKVLEHIKSIPNAADPQVWARFTAGEIPEIWNQGRWMTGRDRAGIIAPGVELTEQGPKAAQVRFGSGLERCGTSGCFAGYTVLMFGETGTYLSEMIAYRPGGHNGYISGYAAELLGLSETQASRLFSGLNKLADLERIVAEFAEAEDA